MMLVLDRSSSICSSYNQFLNEHRLSDTSTSEETDLATTSIRSEKIDNLDTSDEDLSGGGLLSERRGIGVDGCELGGLDGTTLVNGVASDVHDATKSTVSNGNLDGGTGVDGLGTSDETLGSWKYTISITPGSNGQTA